MKRYQISEHSNSFYVDFFLFVFGCCLIDCFVSLFVWFVCLLTQVCLM